MTSPWADNNLETSQQAEIIIKRPTRNRAKFNDNNSAVTSNVPSVTTNMSTQLSATPQGLSTHLTDKVGSTAVTTLMVAKTSNLCRHEVTGRIKLTSQLSQRSGRRRKMFGYRNSTMLHLTCKTFYFKQMVLEVKAKEGAELELLSIPSSLILRKFMLLYQSNLK